MTALRDRMVDAMVLRGFAERTQMSYVAAVRGLARHTHRAPDTLSADEVQAYLLHLIRDKKLAYASVNQASCACRFLFRQVLGRTDPAFEIPMAKVPRHLPRVLSRDEVDRLFDAAGNLRARTLLITTYAAGLRVSEVCALKLSDIERAPDRMCLKVRDGKGGKDRYGRSEFIPTSRSINHPCRDESRPTTLRLYWRAARPKEWLFPNPAGNGPLHLQTAQRMYALARDKAGLGREGGIHTLRHSFATHLLVFTLPHAVNGLLASRPRAVYELLFASASATLLEFAANPRWLGGVPAFSLVLHTWQQDLGRHVHVHALVAGGALAADGTWLPAKRGFLFPVKALSRVFRAKFLAALDEARQLGRLRQEPTLAGSAWPRLKAELLRHDWVVYAKQPLGGPAQVLEYLGRYTHRVAISNERIVAIGNEQVAFRVRAGQPGEGKKRVLGLPGPEFIWRFLLHVLPPGFKRIRHYGLLAAANKAERLAAARSAQDVPPPDPVVIEQVADFLRRVDAIAWRCCPACGAEAMVVIAVIARPTYRPAERAPP